MSCLCRFGREPRPPTPESVHNCIPQMDFAAECIVHINFFECDAFIEFRAGCRCPVCTCIAHSMLNMCKCASQWHAMAELHTPAQQDVQHCTPHVDFTTVHQVPVNFFECGACIEVHVGCCCTLCNHIAHSVPRMCTCGCTMTCDGWAACI